ncbi:MAG TPA: 30S ribosomal protein S6 [bacterium]|nr:30S ribosomal protein S6 [bacterium]
MANYEIVAVLRPDLEDDAIETAIGRIHQRITEHGGSVTATDRWGKRRLAYAIQKYRDGYYVFSVFALQSPQVSRLRQTLGLNEDLLRFVVADHHPAPPRPAAPAAAGQAAASTPTAAPSAPAAVPAAPAAAGSESPAPGTGENDV